MGAMSIQADSFEALLAMAGEWITEWGGRLGLALGALFVGWLLTRLCQHWAQQVLERTHPQQAAVLGPAFSRLVLLAGITLTVALALVFLGVDLGALVATLGLTSVALGFALKDTIEQAVTGMLLLLQQPFHVGDIVEIDNIEGTVSDVGIRTTALRTVDGVHVLVPNNRVYQGIIRNKSHYPRRRHALQITLPPGSDLSALQALFQTTATGAGGIEAEPAPILTLEGYSENGVRAVLRYWLARDASPLEAQTALTRAVDEAAHAAGLDLSPPTTVLVEGPRDGTLEPEAGIVRPTASP
jgi:small-conductance mechanosensitive channel